MPGSVPVFRVFVSSTFSDLGAEREALHEHVFPELKRLCESLGAQFQAIDLRWGVTTEASADQRAVAICLDEVDRCCQMTRRPNFLLLLGDRYGWRPPPATVPAADFERLRKRMAADAAGLVDLWYVEDRNAVPSVYQLQPRRRAYTADEAWQPVERALHEAFRQAAESATLSEEERRRFKASVTELEIRRALCPGERVVGAVHAFFRTIQRLPADLTAGPFVDAWDGRWDRQAAKAVERLRAYVRQEVAPYVREYMATWDENAARPSTDHLDALCTDVQAALGAAIRDEVEAFKSPPTWQQEQREHEEFGAERCKGFLGRQDVLTTLESSLAGARTTPLLLVGAPGSGKTAVLAEMARRLQARNDGLDVMVRFIGATPRSTEVRTLVQDFTIALRQRRGVGEASPPQGTDAAVAAFREELDQPRPERGIVLVIDGLDQLSGTMIDLAWLPTEFPRGVQVVLSAQTGSVAEAVRRHLDTVPVTLEPMLPGEGGRLLDWWLADKDRTLGPHQRAEVLRAFGALGLPLHLRLAFEEGRRWSSSTPVLPGSLADDVPGMVGQLLDRLQLEHGDVLLGAALGYLAASRNGLSEDEELDLLSDNPAVKREVADRFPHSPAIGGRVPPVLWARLYSDLEPYLNERSADGRILLGFFHRQLAEGVGSRYLTGEMERSAHRELARYFGEQALQLSAQDGQSPNLRKLSELPYQQAHAGLWDELYATLTDFRFLEAKATWVGVDTATDDQEQVVQVHSGVYALQDDFDLALQLWPGTVPTGKDPRQQTLSVLARAVSLESHVLAARPGLTWQQLANRLQWAPGEPADLVAAETDRRAADGQVRLRLRTRFRESDALLRRLNPRTDQLSACALSADGTLAASTGMDRTVRVWHAASGRVLRVLRGAASAVACAVTGDGRYAVAASGDGTVHVWRIEDGQHLAAVTAHKGPANACAITPDDHSVVTFGADGHVQKWSLPELHPEDLLADDPEHPTFGALSGDGTTIAYGSRSSSVIRVHTVGAGQVPTRLDHGCPILCCAFADDPDVLVSGGTDGRLVVWDLPAGRRSEIPAHEGEIMGCALAADGTLLASAGDDDTVRLWRLPDLAPLATLQGHQWTVTGCGFNADGTLLISAGGDGTACLWDVGSARAAQRTGHTALVECCEFTPDGSTVLTASTDGTLRRWAVSAGSERGDAARHTGSTVRIAQHGERIVLAAGDAGDVFLLAGQGAAPELIGTHGAQVWGLSLLPDGSDAVTAGLDGTCRVWDLDTGDERLRFAGDGGPVRTCAYDSSGSRIASAGDGAIVHLWDPATGSSVELAGHRAAIWSLAVGQTERLAAGAKDGSIRVWSTDTAGTGTLLGQLGDSVEHLLWAGPEHLVSGSVDGVIGVWPLAGGGAPVQWQAHRGPVRGLAMGPARQILVSVGADGVLALWSLHDGTLLASVPFAGQLRAVAAHPVEPIVACTGDGGLVHIAEIVGLSVPW
jgi:NACHT domain- and WD repeat-containing protein